MKIRHRWLVWLLAAWLPVAGIAAVSASPMMLSMSFVEHGDSAPPEHAGCHDRMMTDTQSHHDASAAQQEDSAAPCCESGACFCNCGVAGSALPVALMLVFSLMPVAVPERAVEFVFPAPSTHPFRPPIA